MLVDIEPLYNTDEKVSKLNKSVQKVWNSLSKEEQADMIPVRMSMGIWHSGLDPLHLVKSDNLDDFVRRQNNILIQLGSDLPTLKEMLHTPFVSSYGLCDGPDNLLQHSEYDVLNHPSRKFTVFVTEISTDVPGFRPHKWGPYIGSQDIGFEYLGDAPGVQSVWVFCIAEHVS